MKRGYGLLAMTGVLTVLAFVLWPATALGYQSSGSCLGSSCHSGNAIHDLHVGNNQMTNNCLLCHTSIGDTPQTNSSGDAEGQGCRGCHGVDNGVQNGWGAGLRARHTLNGVSCTSICHQTDPAPSPENTAPPYYGRGDVNISDPCERTTPGGEDWDGSGTGLDNDGDGLYDGDDNDCAQIPVEESTWGLIKTLYETR